MTRFIVLAATGFFMTAFPGEAATPVGSELPATYTVGNVDGISPGAEGILRVEEDGITFVSGQTAIFAKYQKIQNVDLGARTLVPSGTPLYKIWQANKRAKEGRPARRILTVDFENEIAKEPGGKEPPSKDAVSNESLDKAPRGEHVDARTMAFDLNDVVAVGLSTTIERRMGSGTRRPTNGDGWWGDSAWKTTRNKNTLNPDAMDAPPPK